ncbi:hypothetical protein HMPREF0578_0932 [Mobiluncus mulieris 28-1]|uniref:hypothetical protein n=2 Tax=Mobiluncus mulieris TaxID=2052 RepID=UPI0001BE7F49|nr:hypothetical protein [Mobiluncus mulieris]EEZ91615.1 hypothetical protein HMPREF0578_0932 [Mobiluncus mulieris 28-1]MCU9972123.1 hypothetical protein [Mobiluncus mulieris]
MLLVNIEFPGNATRLPLMTPAAVEAALSLIKGSELPLFYSYVVWRESLQFIQDLSKIFSVLYRVFMRKWCFMSTFQDEWVPRSELVEHHIQNALGELRQALEHRLVDCPAGLDDVFFKANLAFLRVRDALDGVQRFREEALNMHLEGVLETRG